jgi:putative transcriptional regulator
MKQARNLANEIADGLKAIGAWKRGEIALNTFEVELPKAKDVAGIRETLGLSQDAFASFMHVSAGTLRNWEQRRREPQGPARALLLVAAKQPQAVMAAFRDAKPAAMVRPVAKKTAVHSKAKAKA